MQRQQQIVRDETPSAAVPAHDLFADSIADSSLRSLT